MVNPISEAENTNDLFKILIERYQFFTKWVLRYTKDIIESQRGRELLQDIDEIEMKIRQAETPVKDELPEIVTICGSGRFLKQMHEVEERLTLEGKIVLMIGVNTKDVARTENMEHYKPMLDELHLRKIDISNRVYVVDVDGYIGESTRREIAYSEKKGKPIEYYSRMPLPKAPQKD
jgi:hypothetical protein